MITALYKVRAPGQTNELLNWHRDNQVWQRITWW